MPRSSVFGEKLDGPMRYFFGTKWSCETFAGSNETHVYGAAPGTGFVLHNIFRLKPGEAVLLDETYSFDPDPDHFHWTVTLGHGNYVVRSVSWTDNDWIFEGVQIDHGVRVPIRMKYHMYDDVIFRRDFQIEKNGEWVPYAGETCERNDFARIGN